ncbi:MAG: RNA polymerase sigma factor [Planctomycetaceae bacterium]
MDRDDRDLMQRVQDGQWELFDALVRRYRGPLQRVAANKLGDDGSAEDVVQETFLAVFAARQTYNPKFAFRTWLWTILLNLCRRELSKTRRRPQVFAASNVRKAAGRPPLREPSTDESGLTHLLHGERTDLLAKQLDLLPEVQADAIRLRFFGGLKYREIAQTMGGSEIAAKVRVRKGLDTLARRLRDDSGDAP